MASLLQKSKSSCLRNPESIPLYFQAIDAMESSHHIVEILSSVAREKKLRPSDQRLMLEVATRRLENDTQLSRFLSRLDKRRPGSKDVYPAYLEALKKLENDSFQERELSRSFRGDASVSFRRGLLRVAIEGQERDDSMARFLKGSASHCLGDTELEDLLVEAVASIDHDSTLKTTLSRLPWKRLSKRLRLKLLELGGSGIESENQRAEFLRGVSRYFDRDDELREAYWKTGSAIDSERLRERVLSKVKEPAKRGDRAF